MSVLSLWTGLIGFRNAFGDATWRLQAFTEEMEPHERRLLARYLDVLERWRLDNKDRLDAKAKRERS